MLWIDDEVESGDPTVRLLRDEAIAIDVAPTAALGLKQAVEMRPDVILLDVRLPDMYGAHALAHLRARGVPCPIVMATGHYLQPEVEADARRLGAADFLYKPFLDLAGLARVLRAAAAQAQAAPAGPVPEPVHGIIAASRAMRDVVAWVERTAPGTMSVLLTGETGTGKEVVAHAIHTASGRRGRFVAVNCGAIPDTLFESTLFGHSKGAFTGATDAKPGFIEEAHAGTLFLDEVGEMPLAQQVRLLRVLEGGEVWRVGETKPRAVNVRVVAATNRPLEEEIARGRFRRDLYYRLAGATYHVAPLRERREDIEALARHWVDRHPAPDGSGAVSLSPGALRLLRAHPWPGNARELHNVLDRSLSILEGPVVTEREIVAALSPGTIPQAGMTHVESKHARATEALRMSGGDARRAAGLLGINKATLYRWLRLGGRPDSDGA